MAQLAAGGERWAMSGEGSTAALEKASLATAAWRGYPERDSRRRWGKRLAGFGGSSEGGLRWPNKASVAYGCIWVVVHLSVDGAGLLLWLYDRTAPFSVSCASV